MSSPLKQRVLDTADRLFYAEGVRAIGIDRIIEESGVAKASFYRFFPSKDVLIADWIAMRDAAWRAWLEETVILLAPAPAERPLAVFDAIHSRFRTPTFRGCAFLNTIIEMSRSDHPAAQAARSHKLSVIALLRGYLSDAGYGQGDQLALMFMQLIDGALVTALREQKPDAALRAKEMAELLLQSWQVKH